MRRILGFLMIGALAVTTTTDAQDKKKDDKKKLSIADIMKAVPGPKGMCADCAKAAKAEKWDDALKIAKQMKDNGEALGKLTPKHGGKESWEKETKAFLKSLTAIHEAAEKKDSKSFDAGVKQFRETCNSCHTAHKP